MWECVRNVKPDEDQQDATGPQLHPAGPHLASQASSGPDVIQPAMRF